MKMMGSFILAGMKMVRKSQRVIYKDGKLNGKFTYWYENGQKMFEVNFIDGKYDGKVTQWYENGQIEREWNLMRMANLLAGGVFGLKMVK